MDLSQIVPAFGNFAFVIIAFVVALSVIVAIHEYGHYIVGRWCGIHADVFSIGFGPVLFSKTDKRGTDWQIAAVPLGGFVKFMGDANAASVGTDGTVTAVDARRTMLGAPLWARAATVAAGPIFNFILAIAVFGGSVMYHGRAIEPLSVGKLADLPSQFSTELQPGDVLISVEGVPFDPALRDDAIADLVPLQERLNYNILRDGVEMDVEGPFITPPAVAGLEPRSAADRAGLRKGDVITAVDGAPIFAFNQLQQIVKEAEGASLALTLWRDGETLDVVLAPRRVDRPVEGGFETRWLIGVYGEAFFEPMTEAIGPIEAIGIGAERVWATVRLSVSGIKSIILGEISTCNLSGPVGIAETSGSMARQGALDFIWLIGALSAAVGLVNLLPIPVLDGGHLMLYAYEAATRRKPNEKVLQVFMFVGLALILSLMSFTILNDALLCR